MASCMYIITLRNVSDKDVCHLETSLLQVRAPFTRLSAALAVAYNAVRHGRTEYAYLTTNIAVQLEA